MYKLYLKAVALIFFILASLGLLLPFLFSAPSDIAVVGGLFYLVLVFPVACVYQLTSIKKDLVK